MKRLILCLSLLVFHMSLCGQSTYLPTGDDWQAFLERLEVLSGIQAPQFHSSLKPFERSAAAKFILMADTSRQLTDIDQQLVLLFLKRNIEWSGLLPMLNTDDIEPVLATERYQMLADSSGWLPDRVIKRIPLLEHIYAFPSDFFRYYDREFFFAMNPVMDVNLGKEQGVDNLLFINTRGIELRGMINQRVGFYSYVADNQARFPSYVNEHRSSFFSGSVPGEGWAKGYRDGGVDFLTTRAHIALQATKNIGLQVGHDRSKIGSGIRSVLLDDFSNNYLFLRLNTRFKVFHYQNTWARLIDYPLRTFGRSYDHKYAITHYLSIKLSDRLQMGLFENVIVGQSDLSGRRKLDPHYMLPVIFYRAIEHHIGDPDKVALGFDWKWFTIPGLSFYGQVYIDEFRIKDVRADIDSLLVRAGLRNKRKHEGYASFANKFAIQLGSRISDPFGIPNLDIQAEVNLVRPYVYSHYDVSDQGRRPGTSYSHYSQPLGHPLGSNFREWAIQLQYRPHYRVSITANLFNYVQGRDKAAFNFGGNIMKDYRDNRPYEQSAFFLDGLQEKVFLADMTLSWQFLPGWHAEAGYLARKSGSELSGIINTGIRVNVARRKHQF
jgi:hypothetical protein